ncbi:MAG: TIGR02757 family protein [Bacteroidales bacterium]|nr:TIGR02757 family protein [Bacteroidales bacterium]
MKLQILLNQQERKFNSPDFIPSDPISIPRRYSKKEDIEISGFLTALISWGSRKAILNSAQLLMDLMGNEPHNFILSASDKELKQFANFQYRTFKTSDLLFIVEVLKNIYTSEDGLEGIFTENFRSTGLVRSAIIGLRERFLQTPHLSRSEKHLANPDKGSAAKRINMYLRWMVRSDDKGVDFGLWEQIPMSALMIPLDLHTGATARKLGLLHRKQNDWKAVEELTQNLRKFDPEDPVKYDFALFGMGIHRYFPREKQE